MNPLPAIFGGILKIQNPKRRAEFDMIARVFYVRLLTPGADLRVGRFIRANRTLRVRHVRNAQEQIALLLIGLVDTGTDFLDLIADGPYRCFDLGRVGSLFFQCADLFALGLALTLELLLLRLAFTADFIAGKNFVDELPGVATARFHTLTNSVWIVSDGPDIEHNNWWPNLVPAVGRATKFVAATVSPCCTASLRRLVQGQPLVPQQR